MEREKLGEVGLRIQNFNTIWARMGLVGHEYLMDRNESYGAWSGKTKSFERSTVFRLVSTKKLELPMKIVSWTNIYDVGNRWGTQW